MAIVLGAITASAFLPTFSSHATSRSPWTSSPRAPSTYLQSSQGKERIKKAGAGLATIPPGDLCLYDPNESGKLQGTSNLMERLQRGASFGAGDGTASPEGIMGASPSTFTTHESSSKKVTTNLTKVLGEMDSRMRGQGRSQY
jgi:hypothetical protein